MNIVKNLQGWLPVIAILAYVGLTRGVMGILNIILLLVIIIPVAWILMRLIAGTWNIKEISRNSRKESASEYAKTQVSFWKYAGKLFLMAVIITGSFIVIFAMVMKKYFLN